MKKKIKEYLTYGVIGIAVIVFVLLLLAIFGVI